MREKRRGSGEGVADDMERTGLKKQPSERNFERYTKSLITTVEKHHITKVY